MKNTPLTFLKNLQPLRIMLTLITIVLILFVPKPGTQAVYEGIAIVSTIILPSLVPMVFMGLLLDAVMSRVMHIDLADEEKHQYRFIMYLNLGLAVLLLLRWLPFFLSLGRFGNT